MRTKATCILACALVLAGCRTYTQVHDLTPLAELKVSDAACCMQYPESCVKGRLTEAGKRRCAGETYATARRQTLAQIRNIATANGRRDRSVIEAGDRVFVTATKCGHEQIEEILEEVKK